MMKSNTTPRAVLSLIVAALALLLHPHVAHAAATINTSAARLQSIDKVTARTLTFDVKTGSTVKFGSIYIKLQACRRAPDIEEPESAAFMQVWEVDGEGTENEESKWIFSGWMFASSPGLSAMDHPIYDVWVLECLAPENKIIQKQIVEGEAHEGEGIISEDKAPVQPDIEEE